MLIRSWTRKEISARVGMIVSHPVLDKSPLRITMLCDTPFGEYVSVLPTDPCEYYHAEVDVRASDCTMLYCPFEVGDEVEFDASLSSMQQKQFSRVVRQTLCREQLEMIMSGEVQCQLRHASPDLRNAPDYKPDAGGGEQ